MSEVQRRRERLVDMAVRLGARPSAIAHIKLQGTYEADPPEDWVERCGFLLCRYEPMQQRVRDALGWDAPAALRDLEGLLMNRRSGLCGSGLSSTEYHEVRIPTGEDGTRLETFPFMWPMVDPALPIILRATLDMQCEMGCKEDEALAYLLCDRHFVLPWVKLQWDCVPAIGIRFSIDVGSADVTAKELASIYNDAVSQALGSGRSKRTNYQTLAIALHDLDGRAAGKSNRQRWKDWQTFAEPRGLETYPDGQDTATLGERTYRTTVNRALKRMPWLHALVADSETEAE